MSLWYSMSWILMVDRVGKAQQNNKTVLVNLSNGSLSLLVACLQLPCKPSAWTEGLQRGLSG